MNLKIKGLTANENSKALQSFDNYFINTEGNKKTAPF
jgi:hypothetical protein